MRNQPASSLSTPFFSSVISWVLNASTASLASVTCSSSLSSRGTISVEDMALAFVRGAASSSTALTFSSCSAYLPSNSAIFSFRPSFTPSSSFSCSSLCLRRTASFAISRTMPICTFSRWKSAFFTPTPPLPPSVPIPFRICVARASVMLIEASFFAYPMSSFLLRNPSLSRSNFVNLASSASYSFRAAAFRVSFSCTTEAVF
mmetsp:Transcript_6849/g.16203  ORF Transcript_6849/g.16203 Transcript_6849/m.16203 type:complete len:203 (-) Transcript_6849:1626-2234(-)